MERSGIESQGRRLFVSYAREDREAVQRLSVGLRRLRHEVWIDERLSGGQSWWAEILRQIQACDAVLAAVSPAMLESEACERERTYARQLGKPLLPVFVQPLPVELLPPDLAPLQGVDYWDPGPEAAFDLADAVASLPGAEPLPVPLPEPPPTPSSYMHDLVAQAHTPGLSLEDQLTLVARLTAALSRKREEEAARGILTSLRGRSDLYESTARAIDRALTAVEASPEPSGNNANPAAASIPAGWYPDPSGHHKLRWFDRDWTEWASDGGPAIEDPLS